MKYKDFEDFLRKKHADQYTGTDDLMPDDYEDWLMDLSADDFIDFGNEYGKVIKSFMKFHGRISN
ncbi:MAG: hypothetical protein UT24_C0016G0026 [Candidatus Woesebacteria bacterium GW2011_GWB1_39_12]|uniref:Uncharacterized protein n=1 Tax=Candidatus Woesebacteria bacterium GW2011_GWB1_39_12 TaxID=1618574 RepID=A0A0G0QEL0_9BACT|nr:MAG: hypothetical protein UT24_C0016G0026 [Candidatus Woesebacteria bacterium GW2011_GWB1_39_12]